MKIFDIHVHIYPDKIAEKAARSIGEFYGDCRIHGDGSVRDCLARMDEAGVVRFAAHSVALQPRNAAAINRFILSVQAEYPDRVTPFAALHPDMEDLPESVFALAAQGFKGFKIHPDMQRFYLDSDRAMPMFSAAAETGLPVLIHCGDDRYDYDGPRRILALRDRLPNLKMICAHLGGWMEWNRAEELLLGEGLTVDASSSLFQMTPEHAAEIIRGFGTENVLYGTDYPMWDPAEELRRFMRVPLTERERADILWNNANRLLKLD